MSASTSPSSDQGNIGTTPPKSPLSLSLGWIAPLILNLILLAIAIFQWLAPTPTLPVIALLVAVSAWTIALIVSAVALWRAGLGRGVWFWAGLLMVGTLAIGFLLASVLPARQVTGNTFNQLPYSAQLESSAWQALGEQHSDDALKLCDLYLNRYLNEAKDKQDGLDKLKVPVPDLSALDRDAKLKLVDDLGLMNSAANCYIIRGRAYEALKQPEQAIAEYQHATELPNAIAYDPSKGIFWSQTNEAMRSIRRLK